jgi:hypothetical protein
MHIYFSFKKKCFKKKKEKKWDEKIGGWGAIDRGAIVLDPIASQT